MELNEEERIIRTFKDMTNIDATIIEIIKKDQIKEDYSLSPCDEEDYECDYINLINQKIQITQFSKGKNLSLDEGKILEIDLNGKYQFTYDARTKCGSSGSPIFIFLKRKSHKNT